MLTAAFVLRHPGLTAPKEARRAPLPVVRVWITEKEAAVSAWLRKQAAAFEKATGQRVYLRTATEEEAEDARGGREGVVGPDLLIGPGAGAPVALKGYALIVRDESAAVLTPAPTSALFFRPSPTPGPSPTPPPAPDWEGLGAVLVPADWRGSLPGAVVSADPAGDLAAGKAPAALLTAGQTARLAFGFRAWAVPGNAGGINVNAKALSPPGEELLVFLRTEAAQRTLRDHGLYAVSLGLYGEEDPLRALIESSLHAQ